MHDNDEHDTSSNHRNSSVRTKVIVKDHQDTTTSTSTSSTTNTSTSTTSTTTAPPLGVSVLVEEESMPLPILATSTTTTTITRHSEEEEEEEEEDHHHNNNNNHTTNHTNNNSNSTSTTNTDESGITMATTNNTNGGNTSTSVTSITNSDHHHHHHHESGSNDNNNNSNNHAPPLPSTSSELEATTTTTDMEEEQDAMDITTDTTNTTNTTAAATTTVATSSTITKSMKETVEETKDHGETSILHHTFTTQTTTRTDMDIDETEETVKAEGGGGGEEKEEETSMTTERSHGTTTNTTTTTTTTTNDNNNENENENHPIDSTKVALPVELNGGDHSSNNIHNSNKNDDNNGKDKVETVTKSEVVETATTTTTTTTAAAALPQPPVMKGTLCIDMVHEQQYRHLIRGMWNYENSTTFPPQRFELVRNLSPDEDTTTLPVNGEFHGSFSLAYFHTTSKGKQKERSKIIQETGVQIQFIPVRTTTTMTNGDNADSAENSDATTTTLEEYNVEGTGTNQFGIFHIYGTATRNPAITDTTDTTPTMSIVFRKRYEPGVPVTTTNDTTTSVMTTTTHPSNTSLKTMNPSTTTSTDGTPTAATTTTTATPSSGPLPDPATSFPSGVVALRGTLFKEESNDLGSTEVVHRINGTWASGLDYIEADPQNLRGLCNRFEYEHKSAVPTQQFPVSGKYSGWFDLSNEDGTRTRINERDVLLKFRTNNQGYQNVEGKGSNVFGKYTITGTLTEDNILTIFRHFQPRKFKKSTSNNNNSSSTSALLSHDTTTTMTSTLSHHTTTTSTIESNTAAATAVTVSSSSLASSSTNVRRSITQPNETLKLSFDDVTIPSSTEEEPHDPIVPPAAGTYSAVSRGVLRINDDGSHGCQGKWAATREHFTNGQTSNFTFRLEPHFVAQESSNHAGGEKVFPLDSAMYKGSFQLKKQASRYQTIIDQQIVMKFKRNKQGAYNVHGTGINAIGEFHLLGTLVTSGKTGGQVELYRMYPPEKLAVQPIATTASSSSLVLKADAAGSALPKTTNSAVSTVPTGSSSASGAAKQQHHQLQRRESSRMSKLPPRLEEDDPDAQLSRTMDRCLQLLKFMRERDIELGAFFSEPVDPVALGIPTYVHIIKEPMDLRTIENKMNAGSVDTPEEFARLVRLVFENAMTFNVDPGHSVHQAARNLLVIFNQKFRDVDRAVQSIRRAHGIDVDESGRPRGKDDKKRKRQEEPKSMKRIRIEEAQVMATANAAAVSAIVGAMPTTNTGTVTRNEFSLLLNMVQQLQHQIVQTHFAVAELCPGDANDENDGHTIRHASGHETSKTNASSTGEKKKAAKRKSEAVEEAYVPPVETTLPLTEKEQELLMETINDMPQEHLGGILEIIREAAPVDENDDVIDLGIDQLDDETQRKLFRHIQVVSIAIQCF